MINGILFAVGWNLNPKTKLKCLVKYFFDDWFVSAFHLEHKSTAVNVPYFDRLIFGKKFPKFG